MVSFAVSFRMGLLQKPSILSYFNRQHVLSTHLRLYLVVSYGETDTSSSEKFHFTDPENENCDYGPRKFHYFLETMVSKCKRNYTFKELIAIDLVFITTYQINESIMV